MNLGPIGLKLDNTSELQVDKLLFPTQNSQNIKTNRSSKQRIDNSTFLKNAEKMKAANFPAKLVRIGTWLIESKIEGDLVAKCYYAKKKLVWEYLDKSIKLKKKIEIQWSDISAIRATVHEDAFGILDIELHNIPTFYDEDDPQPRKHTCWKLTTDFTGGQGSIHRRHQLVFLPGYLDKHYEKLLSCDERLFELSQKPFPSSKSPFFTLNSLRQSKFSFENKNTYGVQIKPNPHFSHSYRSLPSLTPLQTPTYEQQTFQAFSVSKETTTSPVSVIEYQQINENGNPFVKNPVTTYCDTQGMNSYGNALARNQVQTSMSNALVLTHNNNPAGYRQNFNISTANPQSEFLSNIEDHLLSDSMPMDNDEAFFLPRVDSLNALLNLSKEENDVPSQSEISGFDWRVLIPLKSNENQQQQDHYPSRVSNENQQVHYHSQISDENLTMQQLPMSVYGVQDFSTVNAKNETNDWDAFMSRRH